MHISPTEAQGLAPTVPGTPFEGGYYAGRLRVGDEIFALIVSPAAGEAPQRMAWGPYGTEIQGADSFFDGAANTAAMAAAGLPIALWAQGLDINGHQDWYLPSRDELELLYRNLKPTAEGNYIRYGDNPSSIPAGYPYKPNQPAQTAADAFREGGAEALADEWYWSSTQFSAHGAWGQGFDDGFQGDDVKSYEARARAVRRFKLSA